MSKGKSPVKQHAKVANPLTEHLLPNMDPSQLAYAMRNEPLRQSGFQLGSGYERKMHIELRDLHYWPTSVHQGLAESIQTMLWHGLNKRNPLSQAEQVRLNILAGDKSADPQVNQNLRCEVSGCVVSGITGVGKSATIRRTLSVLGPQLVAHTRSEAAGWSRLLQVTYLFIDFPAQPSRIGLYATILGELDRVLGTSYLSDLRSQRDLESKAAFVTRMLSLHRVGILVVDENQQSTLDEATWGDVFVNYFIRLMNIGIPVLLSGNPLAFRNLAASAQLARRFARAGWYDLEPAQRADTPWWVSEYVPGAMRFSVLKNVPTAAETGELTFRGCAGIPAFFMEWWAEAQSVALKRRPDDDQLTAEDIAYASHSPKIKPLLKIAEAVISGNRNASYGDIPRSVASLQMSDERPARKGRIGPLHQEEARDSTNAQERMRYRAKVNENSMRKIVDDGTAASLERGSSGDLEI